MKSVHSIYIKSPKSLWLGLFKMEEVGFGLAHSRVTAIQRFDFSVYCLNKSAPASARSRNPLKSVCKRTP